MDNGTMKAAVFYSPNDLRFEEAPKPHPDVNEVLVEVERCGICGTDAHIVHGAFPVPNVPLIIGHEFAGKIAEVGNDVTNVQTGDRVTVDINMACGTCYFCRRNSKLLCQNLQQLGVHTAGAMAEYVRAPAENVYRLPDSMSLGDAAFVEPLACTIHGQDRVSVNIGDTVVIIGGGPTGLAHVALAKLRGATRIIVSARHSSRQKRAEQLGADIVIDPTEGTVIQEVLEATDGLGADVVIEAVGSAQTYVDALNMVRSGGRVLAYGAAPQEAEIPLRPFDVFSKELSIVGSYAGSYETWPEAIEIIESGRLNPSLIVDTVEPLREIVNVMGTLKTDKSIVKAQVHMETP